MQKLMEEARAEAEQLGLTREQLGLKQLQDPGIDLGPAVGARVDISCRIDFFQYINAQCVYFPIENKNKTNLYVAKS